MNEISLSNTLNIQDSILVKGECRDEYRNYIQHLILLFKNKISEGSLLEATLINQQINDAIKNTPTIKIVISELLQAQLHVCRIELFVKQKQKDKLQSELIKLKIKLASLLQQQKDYISYKVNNLVLYDDTLEVFDGYHQHPDKKAIKLFKDGNYLEAAHILEFSLKSNLESQYNIIRRVIIGKILLQKQDLSGFAWLNYVIQTTEHRIIQKYQARLIFISAYKVLIVEKGLDPQLATIPIEKIVEECFLYFESMKQINIHSSIQKVNEAKSKIVGTIVNKIINIQYALNQIYNSACYPKSSIEELDLRIHLAQLLYQQGEYNRCLDETERSKTTASQLDIYYWQRQARLSKLSALSYMRLGYYESVIELLERVMKIQPDRVERLKCVQWKLEAQKFRTEESTMNQQSQLLIPFRENLRQRSVRSEKSNKSSLRSQKSHKSSKQTIQTVKKDDGSKIPRKPISISLNRELSKIRKTSAKSYQYRFKNRQQIRDSLRASLNQQPKCCLLF